MKLGIRMFSCEAPEWACHWVQKASCVHRPTCRFDSAFRPVHARDGQSQCTTVSSNSPTATASNKTCIPHL
eukprot:m.136695 g.136695  ORF g.136695 m.136695 type:complete len:71 (-) comp17580_c0_seq2:1737-1949(-)